MIKHIVLFKSRDDVSVEKKLVVMNSFREATEVLPVKISVVHKVKVGPNMNPGEIWNTALYGESGNPDDVKPCATHPEHVAASKILVETKESRVYVDYEFQL